MIDAKALQKLMSFTRRAIDKFDMIEDGDRIAVGVSGGKDSLALLCALQGLSRFYPKRFEVVPINLFMGFPGEDNSVSKALCEELGLTLNVVGTGEIYPVVFEVRKEKHPCSLCSNMRRGGLHNAAKELGCNKLALGHHFDDAVETIIMNLFIEGRFDCFYPVTYLDRSDITVIRPLLFAPEKEVSHFVRACGIVPVPKNCPADGVTKREDAKRALDDLERSDRGVKMRVFNAFFNKNEENK
jgi:tRNA(Ile)-lysidine synthase TilS/MesJ